MGKVYKGEVKAKIIEARFAISGKVVSVNKKVGDTVKKWEGLSFLDRKILQTELDSQLADYEKVRADFEIFNQKNPNPTEVIDKYLKTEKQASLNASVKQVEIAKIRLDQVNLFSPVDGIVIDDGGTTVGIYITPSSSSFKIVDTSSYYFEFEIEQKEIQNFTSPIKTKIKLDGLKDEVEGECLPVFSDGKKFIVKVPMSNQNIMLGMKGIVKI